MKNKIILSILLFWGLWPSKAIKSERFVPDYSEISELASVLYYGYFNNEHYQHWLPTSRLSAGYSGTDRTEEKTGKTRTTLKGKVSLRCNTTSGIQIDSAYFISAIKRTNPDPCSIINTKFKIKASCNGKSRCDFDTNSDLFFLEKCPSHSRELVLTYSCHKLEAPQPLFDIRTLKYREGLSNEPLIINHRFLRCGKDALIQSLRNVSFIEAQENCSRSSACRVVIWSDQTNEAILCSINVSKEPWAFNLMRQKNVYLSLKPESFRLPGYAVLLNQAAYCKSEDRFFVGQDNSLDLQKLAGACNRHKSQCDYFSVDMRSQGGRQQCLCTGTPTIIAKPGYIAAVRAQESQMEKYLNENQEELKQGYPTETQLSKNLFRILT